MKRQIFLKLHQQGKPLLVNIDHFGWATGNMQKGTRIKAGLCKLIVDETYEQIEALLHGCEVEMFQCQISDGQAG